MNFTEISNQDQPAPQEQQQEQQQQQQQQQQLSPVARRAYDEYGRLDPNRVQLLTRGLFLSREEAADLPTRIEVEGRSHTVQTSARVVTPRASTTNQPSDRGNWTEEDVRLLIRLHAERTSFTEISEHFPGKSQKACQEKFYHTTKDPNDPSWKEYHDTLRREHDEKKKSK
ncbi:hypothetical protein VP1G_06719 [Cytospora mali]|uniref:Myb-like domain-containing protein n=1 Tax=Cytospora mali TaxID=578113 RepID=A0A194V6R6_CYTMA|nr:hypothetical protein VP1G_06719 [Valsa mali var. pyri (nom. inval.)]